MSGDRKTNQPTPSSILGLCNPLLDITASVDQEILEKYNLKANDAILARDEHKDLCKEMISKYTVDYTAGGSAQNVMRVIAGILRRQNVSTKVLFTGCIGKDEYGEMMSKKANEDGVETHYSIDETVPTGTCAVCLTEGGKNRSLCAFLGASQKFSDQHLRDNWSVLVDNIDIIYLSGFLLAVSPTTYELLGKHIAKTNNFKKRFCLNLSAPYISSVYGNELEKVLKYVDIVFGNVDEAKELAKHMKWTMQTQFDMEKIARKICLHEKVRKQVDRIVVITDGDRPITIALQDGDVVTLQLFKCETIPKEEMVDTNGAGDSFAGGFLSQFIQGKPIDFCVSMGTYAAREIIKVSGITIPSFEHIPELPTPAKAQKYSKFNNMSKYSNCQ